METSVTAQTDTPTLPIRHDGAIFSTPEKGVEKTPEPPPQPPPPEAALESTPCPRCGAKLFNPGSLGWCPKCGYCRSLEEDAPKAVLQTLLTTKRTSSLGISEFFDLVARLPRWLWVLLGGAAILALLSVAANFVLPEDSLPRALWSTIQLALGLIGLLAAQTWALILLAPHDDNLSSKDIILSTRLWNQTFRRLPEMRKQVWLGGWSVVLALCGVFVVGGLSYWYQFYKPKRIADKNLLAAAAAMAKNKDGKSLEEAVQDFANTQDLTKNKADKKDELKEDKRPTSQCLVLGYTVDDKVLVTGLVLATLRNEKLSYAGVVQRGFTPDGSKELIKLLKPLQIPEPLIPGLKVVATWVRPELFCEVHHSDFNEDGHLQDPNYKGLLKK